MIRAEIRPIRAEEIPVLENFLYEAIFLPEGVAPPPRSILNDPALQVYLRDFGKHPDDLCLVADAGGIIGAVWTRIMDDYGHVDDETPSLAISLYPEYRHQGIGTALMRGMLRALCDRGYSRVSLSVQKANYAARMYRNLGFSVVRETDEEWIMVRTLASFSG